MLSDMWRRTEEFLRIISPKFLFAKVMPKNSHMQVYVGVSGRSVDSPCRSLSPHPGGPSTNPAVHCAESTVCVVVPRLSDTSDLATQIRANYLNLSVHLLAHPRVWLIQLLKLTSTKRSLASTLTCSGTREAAD